MRIVMTGNPNSGKTTMFNALTGRSQRVETGRVSPFTLEESITSSYVKNEHPDVIINIVAILVIVVVIAIGPI